MRYRIIGCGNPDRGDDAAGLLVVRRLREAGLDACEHSGDGLALVEDWRGEEAVILIDAVVTGGPPGAVTVWDGSDAPVVEDLRRCSTHAFGIAEAVKMARVLARMPPKLLIYGIEGRRFDFGSQPSPEVGAAVEHVVRRIAAEAR